jgi:hypothetical protein
MVFPFRDIVRNAVHASEHDAVIFTGNGCTGAVHKLINALNFTTPPVSTVHFQGVKNTFGSFNFE